MKRKKETGCNVGGADVSDDKSSINGDDFGEDIAESRSLITTFHSFLFQRVAGGRWAI